MDRDLKINILTVAKNSTNRKNKWLCNNIWKAAYDITGDCDNKALDLANEMEAWFHTLRNTVPVEFTGKYWNRDFIRSSWWQCATAEMLGDLDRVILLKVKYLDYLIEQLKNGEIC